VKQEQGGIPIPAALSDRGCVRELNEDRYAAVSCAMGEFWVICDGMGGVMGGDLAAQLAVEAIRRAFTGRRYSSSEDAVKRALEEANRVIVLRRQNPAFVNMGTTVVAALVSAVDVTVAHAGDSRAYQVSGGGNIRQLTVDHTYVQTLVEQGEITQDEALSHPQAHVLTRCLGSEPKLKLDLSKFWLWKGTDSRADTLVLCSDGLYSLVSDAEIAESIRQHSPQDSCAKLTELAKTRGGYDNISVVVIPLDGVLRDYAPEVVQTYARTRDKKDSVVVRARRGRLPIAVRLVLAGSCLFLGAMVQLALSMADVMELLK